MDAVFEINREFDNKITIILIDNDLCPPHFHSNIELAYVVDGTISLNINGQIKTLTKGCMAIANSYDIHSYQNIENSRIFVMIIPAGMVANYHSFVNSKVLLTPFIEDCKETRQVYHMIRQLYKKDCTGYDELVLKGGAYYILGLLLSCLELVDKPSAGSTDLARKILVYMQENHTNPLSIEALAKHFGYNKDYLSRFFNSYLGCGFNGYLNTLRARHAAELIMNGRADLTEVAFASGFDNYRTFNRAFNLAFGMTPSGYRKNTVRS